MLITPFVHFVTPIYADAMLIIFAVDACFFSLTMPRRYAPRRWRCPHTVQTRVKIARRDAATRVASTMIRRRLIFDDVA